MPRRPDYRAYILRLWRIEDGFHAIWRASLLKVRTSARRGFASLDDAMVYLHTEIASARGARDVAPM